MADWKPPKAGCPTWIEITSTDQARSHKFYSTVFNWTWINPEVLDKPSAPEDNKPVMMNFNPDVNLSGGISLAMNHPPPKFAPRPGHGGIVIAWLIDDIEATSKVIEEAGGKIVSEVRPEGDHGMYRYFEDVDGNLGSIYQFKPKSV